MSQFLNSLVFRKMRSGRTRILFLKEEATVAEACQGLIEEAEQSKAKKGTGFLSRIM
jgi:hypothetical protein